jgi:hypothetical protein
MKILSDYLKAILYPENLLEYGRIGENRWSVAKDQCPVIQHFAYKVQRNRNDAGIPYGGTTPTELKFTIRLGQPDDSKLYYQHLVSNELFEYSFIFNATFDDNKRLKNFEDAMVTRGYVVDVKEDFDVAVTDENLSEQIMVEVTLLLSSITYVGKEDQNNRKLEITNY